jgi:hypothetical protein
VISSAILLFLPLLDHLPPTCKRSSQPRYYQCQTDRRHGRDPHPNAAGITDKAPKKANAPEQNHNPAPRSKLHSNGDVLSQQEHCDECPKEKSYKKSIALILKERTEYVSKASGDDDSVEN